MAIAIGWTSQEVRLADATRLRRRLARDSFNTMWASCWQVPSHSTTTPTKSTRCCRLAIGLTGTNGFRSSSFSLRASSRQGPWRQVGLSMSRERQRDRQCGTESPRRSVRGQCPAGHRRDTGRRYPHSTGHRRRPQRPWRPHGPGAGAGFHRRCGTCWGGRVSPRSPPAQLECLLLGPERPYHGHGPNFSF